MVARGWIHAVWFGEKCLKFARIDELSEQDKSIMLRLGYRAKGPYLVKKVYG